MTTVQNIWIVKDGNSLGNGSICGIGSDSPNSSFNLSNVPHMEIKTDALVSMQVRMSNAGDAGREHTVSTDGGVSWVITGSFSGAFIVS